MVLRRTADLELRIAVEKDRLIQQYLLENNKLDPTRPAMTITDLSPSTVNFYTLFATFSQTVESCPKDFDPTQFMYEWTRDEVFEFLNAYLDALGTLERSFRRRAQGAVVAAGVEQPASPSGTSVESQPRE